jgi:hypothetical protein
MRLKIIFSFDKNWKNYVESVVNDKVVTKTNVHCL